MFHRLSIGLLLAGAIASPALAQDSEWKPLNGKEFGTEIGAKWIPVPNGSSGAPRQGWLGTADGFFTREVHLAYSYTQQDGPDGNEVLARFHYPLTRRLWVGVEAPFYQSRADLESFGDITVTTQVMLAETRNLSINAGVGWRLPTGQESRGNSRFIATPQVNLWSDVGSGFSIRGRVAYELSDQGSADSFVLNAAVGQTVTPHDRAPLGDLTWYVAGNWRESVTGGSAPTFLSVTPGVRTHLTNNLFLLGGVEFPLMNRDNYFRERYIVQLVKGF